MKNNPNNKTTDNNLTDNNNTDTNKPLGHDPARRAFVRKSLATGIIAAQPSILAGLIRADGGGGGSTTNPWGTTMPGTTMPGTTYPGTTYATTSPWGTTVPGTTYSTTYQTTYATTTAPTQWGFKCSSPAANTQNTNLAEQGWSREDVYVGDSSNTFTVWQSNSEDADDKRKETTLIWEMKGRLRSVHAGTSFLGTGTQKPWEKTCFILEYEADAHLKVAGQPTTVARYKRRWRKRFDLTKAPEEQQVNEETGVVTILRKIAHAPEDLANDNDNQKTIAGVVMTYNVSANHASAPSNPKKFNGSAVTNFAGINNAAKEAIKEFLGDPPQPYDGHNLSQYIAPPPMSDNFPEYKFIVEMEQPNLGYSCAYLMDDQASTNPEEPAWSSTDDSTDYSNYP